MISMATAEAMRDLKFEEIREVVAPIAERNRVDRIYIFGSRARGDNKENSDFDFYIIPGRIQTLTKLCRLMRELEEALGGGVDIVSEGPSLREDFTKEIFRDRRLIYETQY